MAAYITLLSVGLENIEAEYHYSIVSDGSSDYEVESVYWALSKNGEEIFGEEQDNANEDYWINITGLDEKTTYTLKALALNASGGISSLTATVKVTTAGTYSITYTAETGIDVPEWESFECGDDGTTITISDFVPEKSMYDFKRWKLVKSGSVVGYAQPEEEVTVTRGYYTAIAEWAAKQPHSLTYAANGGVGIPSAQAFYTGEPVVISSTVPKRTNYNFDYWAVITASGEYYTIASPGEELVLDVDEDVTLIATWYMFAITVQGGEFAKIGWGDFKGKSGVVGLPHIDYDGSTSSEMTVTAILQEEKGYEITFDGWYRDGEKVSSGLSYTIKNPTEEYTLTAQANAEKIDYRVNLAADSGIESTSGGGLISMGYSTTISCALKTLENGAVAFDGWWKQIGEDLEFLSAEQEFAYTPDSDVTLFAKTLITWVTPPTHPGNTAVAAAVDGGWRRGTAHYGLGGKWIKANVFAGVDGQWLGGNQAKTVTISTQGDKYTAGVSPTVEVLVGSVVTMRCRLPKQATFDGWYDQDGARLTEEQEYQFKARKDLTLTARVGYVPTYTLTTEYGYSSGTPASGRGSITYKGETYTLDVKGVGPYQIEVVQGDSVTISVTGKDPRDEWSIPTVKVSLNGTVVASEKAGLYYETVLDYTYTPQADATIEFSFNYASGYYFTQADIVEGG